MKTPIIIIVVITLLIGIIGFSLFLLSTNKNNNNKTYSDNVVVRIIDGDTFELASGDVVRLICVDTPESGDEGYDEAINFLSSLVLYKEIRLESDIDDKDAYNRLLRYVYVNVTDEDDNSMSEIFVNKELVLNGYASLFIYGNNTAKCGEINEN